MHTRERLIDPPELADYLRIPLHTLAQWRYRHEGPPWLKIGRHVRYRLADVESWLAEQSRSSTRSV